MSTSYRLGVDLGGTKIEAALLEPSGSLISRIRRPTPTGDYQGTLDCIRDLVLEIEADHDLKPLPLGIGVPGSPSPASGLMRNANSQLGRLKSFLTHVALLQELDDKELGTDSDSDSPARVDSAFDSDSSNASLTALTGLALP